MSVQQIGFMPESLPESLIDQETVASPDSGQDIFSALLLLALSGSETGKGHFPYFREEGMGNNMENMGSVPHIPPFPAGEKEMEKSPVGPLEFEFLQGAQVLEDAAVSGEKPDLYPLGTAASLKKTGNALIGVAGRSPLPVDIAPVDSASPAMTLPPVIVTGEAPEQPPISHVIKEGVKKGDQLLMQHDPLQLPSAQQAPRSENESAFLHETSMSRGLTKGDENRREQEMRVPDFSLDRGLRLKPDTQQGFSGEINKVTGLFREGDPKNNSNMDSDAREDRRWIGGAEMITLAKKPSSTGNDAQLQSLYKYIEPDKMMHQLTQRLIHASHIGSHTARIRLRPEELGELSMDISVMDNSVKAVISVDSYDVKEVIEANLHKLDEELKNHGLRIEKFTVEMRGGGAEDRSMWAHDREEGVGRKQNGRTVVDNRLDQKDLNRPIATNKGLVSIFA